MVFSSASAFYHDDKLVMQFPYSKLLMEELKAMVPAYARSYDPETKAWSFQHPYTGVAIGLLRKHYPAASVADKPSAASSVASSDHLTLYVIEDAPIEVVKAAYRALSKMYHPDRGGDILAMQRINAAFERLESRLTSGGRA